MVELTWTTIAKSETGSRSINSVETTLFLPAKRRSMRQIHGGIPFPAGSGDCWARVCNMLFRLMLVSALVAGLTQPSHAGIFKRSKKPDPTTYVPELITALKTSKDEDERRHAAAELRDYDGKVFPEILPALIDALANDTSSSVRAEAAESIGKIRPISNKAGYALEQALANEKSTIVRISARTALWQYRILGFIGVSKADLPVAQTKEPPLAKPSAVQPTPSSPIIKPITPNMPTMTPPPPVSPPPASNVKVMPAKRPESTPEPAVVLPTPKVVPPTTTTDDIPKPVPMPVIVIPTEAPKPAPKMDIEPPVPPVPTIPTLPTVPKVNGPSLGPPPN